MNNQTHHFNDHQNCSQYFDSRPNWGVSLLHPLCHMHSSCLHLFTCTNSHYALTLGWNNQLLDTIKNFELICLKCQLWRSNVFFFVLHRQHLSALMHTRMSDFWPLPWSNISGNQVSNNQCYQVCRNWLIHVEQKGVVRFSVFPLVGTHNRCEAIGYLRSEMQVTNNVIQSIHMKYVVTFLFFNWSKFQTCLTFTAAE